jgi:hypothetical protein
VPHEDARLSDFLSDDEADGVEPDDPRAGEQESVESDAASRNADGNDREADPDDTGSDPDDTETGPVDSETDSDDPDPAPTATWQPGGVPCDDCGARADRRWRDDGGLVCADCKGW